MLAGSPRMPLRSLSSGSLSLMLCPRARDRALEGVYLSPFEILSSAPRRHQLQHGHRCCVLATTTVAFSGRHPTSSSIAPVCSLEGTCRQRALAQAQPEFFSFSPQGKHGTAPAREQLTHVRLSFAPHFFLLSVAIASCSQYLDVAKFCEKYPHQAGALWQAYIDLKLCAPQHLSSVKCACLTFRPHLISAAMGGCDHQRSPGSRIRLHHRDTPNQSRDYYALA